MPNKLIAWTYLGAALLLALLACATLVALVGSLTVGTTLAAVESAFGSLVLLIILMVAARSLFEAGRRRIKSAP